MLTLFWIVFGALVGGYAAQRKGFSSVAGVVGGALLGPLALLMFAVSGVASASVKCPFCDEAVKPAAKVCKHCRKDLPAAA